MTPYDLINIFRKSTFSVDGVNTRLKEELLRYSYNSEDILFSNLCQTVAELGTRWENQVKKNYELVERIKVLEAENNKHILELQSEHEKLMVYEKALKEMKGKKVQQALVKNGRKIAYKTSAGEMKVLALLRKGYTKSDIAQELGVSRNTVYNRIKTLEKAGISLKAE